MFANLFNLFGYELIKTKRNPSLDSHLRNIIKTSEIDLILDIGANRGSFARKLRKLGFKGQIMSFEPVTEIYERLVKESSGDEHWSVFNFGFGEMKSEVSINKMASSDFSSILSASEAGKALFNQKVDVEYTQDITLQTLDDFCTKMKLSGNIFLKTDTQGFDLNVLKGGKRCLNQFKCVLVETAFIPIYEGVPSFGEIQEYLNGYGFRLSGIYPVSKNNLGQIIETDSLFLK